MSDHTLNQMRLFLKDLDVRVKKLGRKIDELDILAYRYQRLSGVYKDLILECTGLMEILGHIDVVALEIRQEFEKIREFVVMEIALKLPPKLSSPRRRGSIKLLKTV